MFNKKVLTNKKWWLTLPIFLTIIVLVSPFLIIRIVLFFIALIIDAINEIILKIAKVLSIIENFIAEIFCMEKLNKWTFNDDKKIDLSFLKSIKVSLILIFLLSLITVTYILCKFGLLPFNLTFIAVIFYSMALVSLTHSYYIISSILKVDKNEHS